MQRAFDETKNPNELPSHFELLAEAEKLNIASKDKESSERDHSVGGPFGRLFDFEEGRVPFTPPNEALFKYGKFVHLKALAEEGQIRLTPIGDYRDTVLHTGTVADVTEGLVRQSATEYDIATENPSLGWRVSPTSPHVAVINGCTITGNIFRDGGFQNGYIWCASNSELPPETVAKMDSGYDALAIIKDWKAFFLAIGRAMRKRGCSQAFIGNCDYSGATTPIIWKHQEFPSWQKTLPRAFQKIPKKGFEEQREIRMVFYHSKHGPAFNVTVPEIVGLVELKMLR